MTKVLKPARMDRCIGCGLCELMASRIAKSKHSYTDSFVQIRKKAPGQPFFKAVIDYGQKTDYREVKDICPEDCYDIEKA